MACTLVAVASNLIAKAYDGLQPHALGQLLFGAPVGLSQDPDAQDRCPCRSRSDPRPVVLAHFFAAKGSKPAADCCTSHHLNASPAGQTGVFEPFQRRAERLNTAGAVLGGAHRQLPVSIGEYGRSRYVGSCGALVIFCCAWWDRKLGRF